MFAFSFLSFFSPCFANVHLLQLDNVHWRVLKGDINFIVVSLVVWFFDSNVFKTILATHIMALPF